MAKMVLGVFSDRDHAEDAIRELQENHYDAKDISIVMKDAEEAKEVADNTGTNVAEGAVGGATTGGVIGGIAGLLIGIGAVTIPGVGAFLIGGPIAAALVLTGAAATTVSGAATGALAGGLIGALTGLGVSKEDAEVYEKRVTEGGVLVAVPAETSNVEAGGILSNHGAEQVRTVDLRSTL